MPLQYAKYEPISFNQPYKEYVSKKELQDNHYILREYTDRAVIHQPPIILYPPSLYSSVVKNSHQHPREKYNVIKPYTQKQVKETFFQKDFDKTPFYFGSKKYTRANVPELKSHWE